MIPFLLSPLVKYSALAAIILASIGGIYLKGRSDGKETMRPKLEAAQSDADNWRKTAENRKSLIAAQNAAVEGLKAAQDMRVAELNKRLATAILEGQKIRMAAETKVKVIESLQLSENECTALTELIDEAKK